MSVACLAYPGSVRYAGIRERVRSKSTHGRGEKKKMSLILYAMSWSNFVSFSDMRSDLPT